MPRGSIAGQRSTTSRCPRIEAHRPSNPSRRSRPICCASRTGWSPVASPAWRWKPPGVYWIPIYEILEARGIDVLLVNARHIKNVPGRKSDVSDCEWLRDLHSVGLLRGSFRPDRGHCGVAGLCAPSADPGGERRDLCAADAEGAGADEPPTAAGRERHHRRHRPQDPARHRRRPARPGSTSPAIATIGVAPRRRRSSRP